MKTILLVWGVCIGLVIGMWKLMDYIYIHHHIWTAEKKCDFVLPSKYKLAYSEKNKGYTIQEKYYTLDLYMATGLHSVNFYTYDIAPELILYVEDSCVAKGILYKYLKLDQEPSDIKVVQ